MPFLSPPTEPFFSLTSLRPARQSPELSLDIRGNIRILYVCWGKVPSLQFVFMNDCLRGWMNVALSWIYLDFFAEVHKSYFFPQACFVKQANTAPVCQEGYREKKKIDRQQGGDS